MTSRAGHTPTHTHTPHSLMISPGAFPLFPLAFLSWLVHLSPHYFASPKERERQIEREWESDVWSERERLLPAPTTGTCNLQRHGASRCTLRRRGQQLTVSTGSFWGRYTHNPHTHTHTHTQKDTHSHNTHQVDPGGWRWLRRRRRGRGTRQKQKCADTNAMAKRWQLIWVTLSTAPQAAATVAAAAAAAAAAAGRRGMLRVAGAVSCVPPWSQLTSSAVHFQQQRRF